MFEYSLDLRDLPGEEWKDIEEFKGIYQISNKGRVKSLAREYMRPREKQPRIISDRILRVSNGGTLRVSLGVKGVGKTLNTSILVAKAFIPGYIKGKTRVVHINGDCNDNRVENLYCGTCTDVFYTSIKNGKTMGCPVKKVCCVETGQVFDSICEASRWLGDHSNRRLSQYLRNGCKNIIKSTYKGKTKLYYSDCIKGYHFELVD